MGGGDSRGLARSKRDGSGVEEVGDDRDGRKDWGIVGRLQR